MKLYRVTTKYYENWVAGKYGGSDHLGSQTFYVAAPHVKTIVHQYYYELENFEELGDLLILEDKDGSITSGA